MSEPRERVHYTWKRIDALEPRTMDYLKRLATNPWFKPDGLWYSAPCEGDGWEDWCRAEDFGINGLAFRHSIELDLTKLLVIRTVDELDAFHERYSEKSQDKLRQGYVNWLLVFDDYAGIEIAPYQWSRRLDTHAQWYYGWDCASGCVWDLSAVKSWEPQP